MPFYQPDERQRKELRPGVVTRTFWGDNMLLGVVELEANGFIPTHTHPHEQSTYVIRGELEMDIAGEKRWMKAGELAIIPGGVEHTVQVGPENCLVLDVFAPAREDMKY
jgi:quercetin dioxygenase-like cupin family protein